MRTSTFLPARAFPRCGPTPVYNPPGITFRRDSSAPHFVGSSVFELCRLPVCLPRRLCTLQMKDALQRAPIPSADSCSEQLCLAFNVHVLIFECATVVV